MATVGVKELTCFNLDLHWRTANQLRGRHTLADTYTRRNESPTHSRAA